LLTIFCKPLAAPFGDARLWFKKSSAIAWPWRSTNIRISAMAKSADKWACRSGKFDAGDSGGRWEISP